MSWTILERPKGIKVLARCDCGIVRLVNKYDIKYGKSTKCRECTGLAKSFSRAFKGKKPYKTWVGMRQRCNNPRNQDYHHYGGRGIEICKRWDSFENFYKDMGEAPTPKHSIERIDVNGNYEPSNCKWATQKEQVANRRPLKRRKPRQGHSNNSSGYVGIYLVQGRFRATVYSRYIGTYKTLDEAINARNITEDKEPA